MNKILVFDKGGRKERKELIGKKKAPQDFFQGINALKENGFDITHLSSAQPYKKKIIYFLLKPIEEIFSRISNIGIRPLSVHQFRKKINRSNFVVSLTDGFSISLGFYFGLIDKKNKIKLAGGFHKLSDYDRKLPILLKGIYYSTFIRILKRLDYLIFYGEADRINAINHFKIDPQKTYILKFGVDTNFWVPDNKNSFISKYIFSIGQDPARDFDTLLKVKTKRKIHIHSSLLKIRNDENFKVTNGSYHEYKNSFTDLKIRELYQKSFLVIVPLKDVFQPSGYSVTLQALACGKPVILTLTKGLWAPSLFRHLENCILVSPYKPKEIENAIKFLESDRSIYEKISKNARITAEKFFSLACASKSTFSLFSKFNQNNASTHS